MGNGTRKWYKGAGIHEGMYIPADDDKDDLYAYAMNLITRSYRDYRDFLHEFGDFKGSIDELMYLVIEWFYSSWSIVEKSDWWSSDSVIPQEFMLDSWRDLV